ncbi:radical SAM protein [Actinoplanes derwentensis]|uniref:Radical SAM additional 4Fe4S-binding SPASM domain-containing protein n=1 Tax=Actinoplanes derwentensis TaxID=113562 RepID=A0A1H2DDR0_9ACTN|nr:radical SAM protein [Actinoplanes derwentensis]GID90141.1 radical SAM protein [Actinoplanes derwentensis]SDT80729.1 radical SAM additional 4Fe4S-binding SPASM domain-containing protein [Actinoplanes derwentensis]
MSHPRTAKTIDSREFSDLKRTIEIRSRTKSALDADPTYASPIPDEISLQLTYKCNLRCLHCYQWNEQGFLREYSHEMQRTELGVDIIERVLTATDDNRAKLFLWGGEPLMHSKFGEVAQLLEQHPRTVTMCTNGLLMERNAESLLRIGENLNLLVSLDGLAGDHEALRGRGTFPRTVRNIERMLDLQRSGDFRGIVSVSCMVSNETVHNMYEFMEWAEELGVHSVYFQFPWYISESVAAEMDEMYAREFSWLNPPKPGERPTWHSYTYRLNPETIPVLRDSMRRLAERRWRARIRYQPQLAADEVEDFVLGTSRPAQRRSKCLAVSNRMEVHADGNVSSCKFFSEFIVGDLHEEDVVELWRGERFRRVRETLRGTGLMPVCSKCILLYLNGI